MNNFDNLTDLDSSKLARFIAGEMAETISIARGRIKSNDTTEDAFHKLFEVSQERLSETNKLVKFYEESSN